MQTKDDGKHDILPVAERSDHARMPVTMPRDSDGKMRRGAAHGGAVDLRLKPGQQQESFHGIKIGRMRKLEALGVARPLGPALWSISENAEEVLRELGEPRRDGSVEFQTSSCTVRRSPYP